MKITYDPEADMLYIEFKDTGVANSDEIHEGIVADYDSDGNIIGLEVFDASEVVDKPERVDHSILTGLPVAV